MKQKTKEEEKAIQLCMSDLICRKLFGMGLINFAKKLYGKKWKEEGFEFNEELGNKLDKEFERLKKQEVR